VEKKGALASSEFLPRRNAVLKGLVGNRSVGMQFDVVRGGYASRRHTDQRWILGGGWGIGFRGR